MASSGMLRRVALVRTDISEELSASIIRVTIGELGTTLAVTSNRRALPRSFFFLEYTEINGRTGIASEPQTKRSSVALSPQANYTD
jgi:hypothetical protein